MATSRRHEWRAAGRPAADVFWSPLQSSSETDNLIGLKLRAHTLPGQQGKVALAIHALNRMFRAAKPVYVRVA